MLKRRFKGQLKNKAQTMTEYLMMLAAVISVIIFFLRPGGSFTTSLNGAYQQTITMVNLVGQDIFNDITN